jgi:hypothetical protein
MNSSDVAVREGSLVEHGHVRYAFSLRSQVAGLQLSCIAVAFPATQKPATASSKSKSMNRPSCAPPEKRRPLIRTLSGLALG